MDGRYYRRRNYRRNYGRNDNREEEIKPEWVIETAEKTGSKGAYIVVRTKRSSYYVPDNDSVTYDIFKSWWDISPEERRRWKYVAKDGRIYTETQPTQAPQQTQTHANTQTSENTDIKALISEIRRLLTKLEEIEARLTK